MFFDDWSDAADPSKKHGECFRELILGLSGIVLLVSGGMVNETQHISVASIMSVDLVHALITIAVYQVERFEFDTLFLSSLFSGRRTRE